MTSVESSRKATLLLAMSGTEERLQFVLGRPADTGYTVLASREWTVPGESIRFLTPGIQETLQSMDLDVADIDRIACTRGPGSFTGLRLVLAAAEGMAAGSGAQLAGMDYLSLLASGPGSLLDGVLHVMTYARRGLVYIQSYSAPAMTELEPLASVTFDQAATRITECGTPCYLVGTGIRKNSEFFKEFEKNTTHCTLLPSRWDNPSPELLLEAAATADYSQSSIDPIYVRATDAEDNLPNIAKKRGIDPEKAKRRLTELQNS
ncbi:MAG: tRNA (adenosine(37)-N6)-threonylcarbamoyltransferase complex dimerization subunit type 1 TsaB [Desulfovibrio sp.]|nr:tRNA (adenosine(37)-N6)-threonylcarbamoyltransferase complex dimerization subunit type 1 TsaB [Desulfovibrio sp.]|tara:strand:- start:82877 stop:83665 length:789 start_codon:yes stop_codon:yes gene_type:complete